MTNTNEYVTVKHLVDRDVVSKGINTYQLQALTDDTIKIVNIGKFNEIPIVPILAMQISGFNCEMLSFSVTEDEIHDNSYLKMIGFLIQLDGMIVASLDFTFKPESKISNISVPHNTYKGIFEIVLTRRIQNANVTQTIKTFTKYPGKEESVHLLTEVLVENVIKNIKIKP